MSTLPHHSRDATAFDRSLFIHHGSDFSFITEPPINARPIVVLRDGAICRRAIPLAQERYAASTVVL